MLEFIVLGHIPGSQLQITFAWVQNFLLILLMLDLVWLDLKLVHIRHLAPTTPPAKARRVQRLRRIGAALRADIVRVKIGWIRLLARPGV